MKKLFLIMGIGGFLTASSQQKELFDIGKHLGNKKRQDKKILPAMPLPFSKNNFSQHAYGILNPRSSYRLPNGDLVVTMSPYNMPCVQPDMRQFNRMPSIQPDIHRFRTMPNLSTDAQFSYFPGTVKANGIRQLFLNYKQE